MRKFDIDAQSEGDFSSSSNATSLRFQTGASETATTKMKLSSGGNLSLVTDSEVELAFGNDSDVKLTHVADTGLILVRAVKQQVTLEHQQVEWMNLLLVVVAILVYLY